MITNIPAPDHLDKLVGHFECFFKDQQFLKILTQITTEDENELAEREVFPKTINERILRQ